MKTKTYTEEEVTKLLESQRANCWLAAYNLGIKEERSSCKDILVKILNATEPKR